MNNPVSEYKEELQAYFSKRKKNKGKTERETDRNRDRKTGIDRGRKGDKSRLIEEK